MLETKSRQVIHLQKNDMLVLTNQTSGKQNAYKVSSVSYDEEFILPVRVILSVPEPFDKKATAVIGYTERDNVDVLA